MTPMNSSMSKSAELSRSRSLKSFQKRPVLTRLPMLLTKRTISCGSTRCDNPTARTAQKKSGAPPQSDKSGVGQEEEKGDWKAYAASVFVNGGECEVVCL